MEAEGIILLFGMFKGGGNNASQSNFNWSTLDNEAQLDELVEKSKEKPVAIFKHSTRCGISSGAKRNLEADVNNIPENVDFYLLDLISFRNVSSAISARFGVQHESPQMIVLNKGEVVYHASHYSIDMAQIGASVQ